MSQFQSDPTAVLQSAAGKPELQTFLREFCSLMGDHFSELANKDDGTAKNTPVDKDIEKALSQKGVKEALTDPHVQQLLHFLREDPPKAQRYPLCPPSPSCVDVICFHCHRILTSASAELRQKVQVLIENGLLAIQ